MRNLFSRGRCLIGGLLLCLATSVGAADVSPALETLLQDFLANHPAARSARAALSRAEAEARAQGQALYNPELELDYEDATDVTRTVGLAQTLDWSGKRSARDTAAGNRLLAARAALAAARQDMLLELLGSLARRNTDQAAAMLARQRVKLLQAFLELAEQRFAAGDVSRSDVDLARLALSEARMQAASAAATASATEAALQALADKPAAGWPALPALPPTVGNTSAETLLERHPELKRLRAEASAARASVEVAAKDRRPDPTLGLRGGKEENNTLVGVTLSIPLFVRNSFRAELDAANAESIRSEQQYRDALRRARGKLQAAAERYRVTRAALAFWEQNGVSSLAGRVETLQRLWQSGEIDTTDYLVQIRQTLDTRLSALELEASTWEAWLAWLQASGTTEQWLGLAQAAAANP